MDDILRVLLRLYLMRHAVFNGLIWSIIVILISSAQTVTQPHILTEEPYTNFLGLFSRGHKDNPSITTACAVKDQIQ